MVGNNVAFVRPDGGRTLRLFEEEVTLFQGIFNPLALRDVAKGPDPVMPQLREVRWLGGAWEDLLAEVSLGVSGE